MKGRLLVGVLLLAAFSIWKGAVPAFQRVYSDFSNYYVSARLILENQPLDSLYNDGWFRKKARAYGIEEPGKFSPFPPITAFALLPLAGFEPLSAQRVFTVLNLILILGCIWLVRDLTGWSWNHSALLILVSGLGLANNLRFGQVYIVVLFLTLLSYSAALQNKNPLSGGLLAGVAAFKYFTIIYLPAYWLHGKKSLVYLSLGALILLIIFQYLFFGRALMIEFFANSFLPHLDAQLSGQGVYHFYFQSWEGFLQFLFVADPQYNPDPLISWPEGKSWVKYSILLILLSCIVLGITKLKTFPIDRRLPWYLCLFGFGGFTLIPASATYHFVMMAFPVMVYCSIPSLHRNWKALVLFLYGCIGFIPYGLTHWLGMHAGIFFGFPRLWAVHLLFFTLLISIYRVHRSELNSR